MSFSASIFVCAWKKSHADDGIEKHQDNEGEEKLLKRRNSIHEYFKRRSQEGKDLENTNNSPNDADNHKSPEDRAGIIFNHIEEYGGPAK